MQSSKPSFQLVMLLMFLYLLLIIVVCGLKLMMEMADLGGTILNFWGHGLITRIL